MYRVALPYTTRTTGIDVFDTDNLFRQREIDQSIAMLNKDDGTFLKALDLWSMKEPVSQPIYFWICLLYTSPSPRDGLLSRMPSSA